MFTMSNYENINTITHVCPNRQLHVSPQESEACVYHIYTFLLCMHRQLQTVASQYTVQQCIHLGPSSIDSYSVYTWPEHMHHLQFNPCSCHTTKPTWQRKFKNIIKTDTIRHKEYDDILKKNHWHYIYDIPEVMLKVCVCVYVTWVGISCSSIPILVTQSKHTWQRTLWNIIKTYAIRHNRNVIIYHDHLQPETQ